MNTKIILILTLLLLSNYVLKAQQKSEGRAVIDRLFKKFNQNPSVLGSEKETKEYDEFLDENMSDIIAVRNKILKEEAQMKTTKPANQHKPGETNLFPLWEEIPAPVALLPQSKQVNFEQRYQGFINRIEQFKKQLADIEEKHLQQQQTDQTAMMQQSKAMANKNVVVQQMGGADALIKMNSEGKMNMTEQERKDAAARMKQNVMNNPAAFSGVQEEGMNMMMQKMLNDPSYREKFNKMSDAEKQVEMQKFMTDKTVKRDDKAFGQSLDERNKTSNTVNIQQLLGRCLQRMQEAAEPYSNGTKLANKTFIDLNDVINKWYKTQYDALPVVVMGEMREKKGLNDLNKFREFLLYSLQKKEAAIRTVLWNSLKFRTKLAFEEFNDFIGDYPWGKQQNANLVDGSYTEPQVANGVNSIYEEMIRMTKEAEQLTRSHKGQQEQYELVMK